MASARYPGPQVAAGELADPAIVYLPNSNAVMVAGVTLESALETSTAGAEDSSFTIRLLRGGSLIDVVKFNGKNASGNYPVTLPASNADNITMAFTRSGDQEIHKTTGGDLYFRSRNAAGSIIALSTQAYPGCVITTPTSGDVPDVILGANVDPGNSGTKGFVWIPTSTNTGAQTGTPQGVTGNYLGHRPMIANDADSKLWMRFGGTWKSVLFV